MKINHATTTVTLGLYHLLTIGQVYSHTAHVGTRTITKHFMRLDHGMACLDNGMYIPEKAFTTVGAAWYEKGFLPCPNAQLSV